MTVTVITQTCVLPEKSDDFGRWQGETSVAVARFPGFIEQRLIPPRPPLQVDWVILQRFDTFDHAQGWLGSPERQRRLDAAQPMLIGREDVHIVRDEPGGPQPAPASAVIGTRVRPGKDEAYKAWERRIAIAQSKAVGSQGYRLEPPVPGVQERYVVILRFDSEANLQAWLDSPVRKRLLAEAESLTEESHARIASSGFEQWFPHDGGTAPPAPVWKMNLIVLVMLYPIVFLFAVFVGTPLLSGKLHLPFAVSLVISNVASVILTGFLVPRIAGRLGWWLRPSAKGSTRRIDIRGAALIVAIHAAMVIVFWWIF